MPSWTACWTRGEPRRTRQSGKRRTHGWWRSSRTRRRCSSSAAATPPSDGALRCTASRRSSSARCRTRAGAGRKRGSRSDAGRRRGVTGRPAPVAALLRYLRARILALLLILILMSVIVFSFLHLTPGDPVEAMLGTEVDQATKAGLRQALGLDRPLFVQYAVWIGRAARGDLGSSIRTHERVSAILGEKLPVTLELTVAASLVGLTIALPAGVLAAVRRNSAIDLGAMGIALAGVSIPSFSLGVMLILLFALHWRWLPSIGYVSFFHDPAGALRHLALPAVTLGLGLAGALTRMVRSGVLEELGQDYVRTAKAKGLSFPSVINRHVLRNALLPALTVLGVQVSVLLGGAVITEQIFAWPGVGQLAVDAVQSRDYPVLQGTILIVALFATVVQLLVDVAYAMMDPRIRYT